MIAGKKRKSRSAGKPRCRTAIGDLAEALGVPKKRLYVLAPANDPFNAGTPVDRELAEWFADIYRQYGFGAGVHIRKIHYRLVTLPEKIVIPGGKPYENTEECWKDLQKASQKARHLRLVDPAEFEDRRNPQPTIYAPQIAYPGEPEWYVDDFDGIHISRIDTDLRFCGDVPDIYVNGYEYDSGLQPYRLEVWIEKNTTDEVDPVCQKYEANLVPSLGTQSITGAIKMLERAKEWIEDGRPVRVWYVSDFDPAGKTMPVAVARQLEFWIREYNLQADVKLKPLALNKQQVIEYKLPRKPIKESEARKKKFEERYGEGAVELDALEALHPGAMGKLLERELRQYRDNTFQGRIDHAEYEARYNARMAWEGATGSIDYTLDEFSTKVEPILEKYRSRLEDLAEEMEKEIAPLREEAEDLEGELHEEIEEAADMLEVELPPFPEAMIDPPVESDWLFDSTRSFLDQTDIYQAHKNGEFQA